MLRSFAAVALVCFAAVAPAVRAADQPAKPAADEKDFRQLSLFRFEFDNDAFLGKDNAFTAGRSFRAHPPIVVGRPGDAHAERPGGS